MFLKVDKKILIISIIAVLVVLVIGFGAYLYFTSGRTNMNSNPTGQDQTESQNQNIQEQPPGQDSSSILRNPQIEINGTQEEGLVICSDECGDGICQKQQGPQCDNLNCICLETTKECPQDCK